MIESTDPESGRRWRHATSDAGRYFLERAKSVDNISDVLEKAAEVEESLERSGAWESYDEWRISTDSTHRIERAGLGYRVSTECDGVYAATARSIPIALEALHVLFALRKDLFYEIGWASWAGRSQIEPGEGSVDLDHARGDVPYLARISRQAACGEVEPSLGTSIRPTTVDWLDGNAYGVVVVSGNLSMTCVSPTMARANQYAGIFQAVQADMAGLFDWA
jgi:hypothetical protein